MAARRVVRRKRAEEMAQVVVEATKVTKPPVPIERMAEAYGVRLHYESVQSTMSGYLYRDEIEPVIGVNSRHPEVRQRFTVAHELGHLLLHRSAGLRVDREMMGWGRSDGLTAAEEIEANVFAAAVLMPAELLEKDMEETESVDVLLDQRFVRDLAKKYEVSVQALVLRLSDLGYMER